VLRGGLDNRTAGSALVLGYGLLVAVLFRDPGSAIGTATATVQGVVFFLVLPGLGVASGLYAYRDSPYRTGAVFVTASYLAMVGLSLALFVVSPLVTVAGLCLFALAAVSLVASLGDLTRSVGLDGLFS